MIRNKISFILLLTVCSTDLSAQVRIRLFSNQSPESAVFSVTGGKYEVNGYNSDVLIVSGGESVIISKFYGKLSVKTRNSKGFTCDSVMVKGKTGEDSFSLRINGNAHMIRYYSGDLKCYPDLGTLVLINICDIEQYIAGVVRAEGGSSKRKEYFKTQAIIARTYMYKYFNKHLSDRYNVCDNTHCQAFKGLSTDTIINRAAMETRDLVILDKDSTLIISAFHSNCGGETASSEDVWLTRQPYLKKVVDPYCLTSKNANWKKGLSIDKWINCLRKSGYNGKADDSSAFNFSQESRLTDYRTGSFTMPLLAIRDELNLRSTFFSVVEEGDSIILKGRGYGHGVGLCQEGAMVMAAKGFKYRQIIDFYYTGVIISDIKNAVILLEDSPQKSSPKGELYPPIPQSGTKKRIGFSTPFRG
jgi:stage II sporulation protein D